MSAFGLILIKHVSVTFSLVLRAPFPALNTDTRMIGTIWFVSFMSGNGRRQGYFVACVQPPPPLRQYRRSGDFFLSGGGGCTVLWQSS